MRRCRCCWPGWPWWSTRAGFRFAGWRWPAPGAWPGLLRLPWPRWHDAFDIVANLIGYVPLGALLAMAIARVRGAGARAWAAAALAAAALSYLLEVGQGLLPHRVPSLLDWILNSAGAMAGALIGLWLERAGSWGWLQRTGEHWFAQHSRTGLALLLLWPLGLLFPTPVALGLGQVWERMAEVLHDAREQFGCGVFMAAMARHRAGTCREAVGTGRTAGRGAGAAGALPARLHHGAAGPATRVAGAGRDRAGLWRDDAVDRAELRSAARAWPGAPAPAWPDWHSGSCSHCSR